MGRGWRRTPSVGSRSWSRSCPACAWAASRSPCCPRVGGARPGRCVAADRLTGGGGAVRRRNGDERLLLRRGGRRLGAHGHHGAGAAVRADRELPPDRAAARARPRRGARRPPRQRRDPAGVLLPRRVGRALRAAARSRVPRDARAVTRSAGPRRSVRCGCSSRTALPAGTLGVLCLFSMGASTGASTLQAYFLPLVFGMEGWSTTQTGIVQTITFGSSAFGLAAALPTISRLRAHARSPCSPTPGRPSPGWHSAWCGRRPPPTLSSGSSF